MLNPGRRMVCEVSYMQFVDDKVAELLLGLRNIAPVEGVLDHSCMVGMVPADPPGPLTGNSLGVRVEKNIVFVE